MMNYDMLSPKLISVLLEESGGFILKVTGEGQIIDFNDAFIPYKSRFFNIFDLITYTHKEQFRTEFSSLNTHNPLSSFRTNFSFDSTDVEDIPDTYHIAMEYISDDQILIHAIPNSALTHHDARAYFEMINDYANIYREMKKLQFRLDQKNLELDHLNRSLEQRVKEEVQKNIEKQKLMEKEYHFAELGHMMDAIAHQWLQPVSTISSYMIELKLEAMLNEQISSNNVLKNLEEMNCQIGHITKSTKEFREFFRPGQLKTDVNLLDTVNSAIHLLKSKLIKQNIDTHVMVDENIVVPCIRSEFLHVIMNIVNNAIDAYESNDAIFDKTIVLSAIKTDTTIALEIRDTAGGIPEDVIGHIFESNFTTKEPGKGSGIGLYLTKQIIDKIDGKIEVYNTEKGACFKILFFD